MLIAILILVCLLILMSLFTCSGLIVIRKEQLTTKKTIPQLPVVTNEILDTVALEMNRSVKSPANALSLYEKWMLSILQENPILAKYIQDAEENFVARAICVAVYQALKAQAEADNLADLTKIQK